MPFDPWGSESDDPEHKDASTKPDNDVDMYVTPSKQRVEYEDGSHGAGKIQPAAKTLPVTRYGSDTASPAQAGVSSGGASGAGGVPIDGTGGGTGWANEPPGPAPKSVFGSKEFYAWRNEDFKRRNPGQEPPGYYMDYGDKYARIFTDEVRGKLSDKGKKWVDDTRRILQEEMEKRIASGEMNELDPEAFGHMAFELHSYAYQQAGINDLSPEDLSHIVTAPGLSGWLDWDTIGEGLEVALQLAAHKTEQYGKRIKDEISTQVQKLKKSY